MPDKQDQQDRAGAEQHHGRRRQAAAELYGATAEHTEILLDLARGQRQRGRWDGYRAVYPEWFRMFVDLEHDAAALRSVEVEIIPGLLQTESYIRALRSDGQPVGPIDDVENGVRARKERQAILTRDDPPEVSFVLSESCLRRLVGDPDVMRGQLRHLAAMARLHNVQIQVLPFNARAFAGRIVYRFTLLTIPAPGIASPLEFVYVESYDDARYLDDKDAVWTAVGDARSEPECLAHIERVWTDMRPLSLRLRMRADAG